MGHRESWGTGSGFELLAGMKWIAVENLPREIKWLDSHLTVILTRGHEEQK